MKCPQSCLLFIVLCSLHKYCNAQSESDLDIGFELSSNEECFHEDGVYTKVLNTPLLRCALECATRPRCLAVNHRYETTTCELIDNDDVTNLRPGPCQHILKSDISVGNGQFQEFDLVHDVAESNLKKSAALKLPCDDCKLNQACDVVQGKCVYRECQLPNIPNADLIGDENSIGSVIRIRCHKGHRPVNGAVVALCLPTGEWSQSPDCIWDDALGVDQDEPTRPGGLQYNGQYFTPGANCTSVNILATDDWCMFNCNHFPPYCPNEFCECHGNE